MRHNHRLVFPILIALLLAGCGGNIPACDEFAPPPSRKAGACPPPKPVSEQPYKVARYCYKSLAQVECYAEPQPGRTGYLGSATD